MIIIELPNTDNHGYTHIMDMYREWLDENKIAYNFKYINEFGFNHLIEMNEDDALLFRLRFGV